MIRKVWTIFCTLSVSILISTQVHANLNLADGGASGQWFNPTRDGEGIFLEIVPGSSGKSVAVSWFTYDMDGNQMWLTGIVEVSDQATSATIPVTVTDGPVFGPGYNPADLNSQAWGTLTVTFSTCTDGLLAYESSTGFGSDTISLLRLTNIEQVRCTEPPPESPQITPGRWTGEGVCFFVGPAGNIITDVGTTCDLNLAFDSNLNGLSTEGGLCEAEVECEGTWAIVEGSFYCESSNEIAVGSFISATEASGLAQESEGAFDESCVAPWVATPD
jgi:hypothetical protein